MQCSMKKMEYNGCCSEADWGILHADGERV